MFPAIQTLLPDLRIAMAVNDGDDGDMARQNDEVDHVWKTMDKRHPNIVEHHGKLLRTFFDGGVGPTDLVGERVPESFAMRLVPLKRASNIGLGGPPNEQARRQAPRCFNS